MNQKLKKAILFALIGMSFCLEAGAETGNLRFDMVPTGAGAAFGGIVLAPYAEIPLVGGVAIGARFWWIPSITQEEINLKATSIGAHLVYNFSGNNLRSGFALQAFIQRISATVSTSDPVALTEVSGTARGTHYGALIGYQWFWRNGFNFSIMGGVATIQLPDTVTGSATLFGIPVAQQELEIPALSDFNETLIPAVEITLGFTF